MAWAEKLPSGKYRGLYRDPAGRRRSAGTYPHKRRAEQAAAAAEIEARKLGWRDPLAAGVRYADWIEAWWPTRAVEPGTLRVDESRLRARLLPRWADVALIDITRHDVKSWAAELARDGLSAATVQRYISLLSASLAAAVDAEVLTSNPAARIKLTRGETIEQRFLTREEFAAIAAETPSDYDEALVSLLVGTGMRWGEAVGLQVQRIDRARGLVRVAEGWDDRMRRVKPYPKGRKVRDVPLPPWVAAQLEPLIGERRTGHLFDVGSGIPDYHNWRSRVWLPTVDRADVGRVRIHDLRHTYASWLIQDGIPLEEVGRLLGHISPLTTRAYAHLAEIPRAHILAALRDPSRGAAVGQADVAGDAAVLHPIALGTARTRRS